MSYVMTTNFAGRAVTRTETKREATVTEKVQVTPRASQSKTHLMKSDEHWGWSELRDYVVEQIEQRHGPFPRDARKEASIFKRFISTYGAASPIIARYAFEVADGFWNGAPISVNRFTRGSDEWFADVILGRLSSD